MHVKLWGLSFDFDKAVESEQQNICPKPTEICNVNNFKVNGAKAHIIVCFYKGKCSYQ